MPAIPEGFTTLTPTLIVNGAASAIELYKKAFGAQELYRMEAAIQGKLMHACIMIGNSKLFLADSDPAMCAQPSVSTFYMYLDNVDAALNQAKQAGLEELFAAQDMFWGDRMGSVRDRFGITWTIATHIRDVSPEEMEAARKNCSNAA
jgi:PhnB protein